MPEQIPVGKDELKELIQLCAVNDELFCRTFFSKTVRQKSPKFHEQLWKLLGSQNRLIVAQVFRDGAKTSILRMYTAKRIAYGLAHTILYIGKSEGHALRSAKWLRSQIEHNHAFASVFKLTPGSKWQDSEFQIQHGVDEYPIWILAMGIGGSIRGINLDDFRPDLIVIDDVIDEENSATLDGRIKIEDLILGALKDSLAPASESPDAKMVMLQTPLNKDDASCKALVDPEWKSMVFGCFTPETADLEMNKQESAWPERYPTEVLRAEKEAALARNKLSLWLREKECKLVSPETSTFDETWLQFYDIPPERHSMKVVMVIDPVPPPTDLQVAKGLRGKDYEAFAVVGRCKGKFYLLEYITNRGHEPDWTIMTFFHLGIKWRPSKVIVETVAYQKTLSWLLKKSMQIKKIYFVIKEYRDKRSKYDRISDGLSNVTSNRVFFCKKEHTEFISQFRTYPSVSHDDLIESVAIAVAELQELEYQEEDEDEGMFPSEENIPALEYHGGAP